MVKIEKEDIRPVCPHCEATVDRLLEVHRGWFTINRVFCCPHCHKIVGISAFTALAVRLKIGRLPRHTTWTHVVGVAALAGIGFTVSLFVTGLAFKDPGLTDLAKIGIFAGSGIAGLIGYLILRLSGSSRNASSS